MRHDKGSALLIALIVVIVVVGVSGAFLGETYFRSKQALIERELDEAQISCDAVLDQARRYLYLYRSNSTWTWTTILQYNSGFSTSPDSWKDSCVQVLKSMQAGASVNTSTTYPEAPVPAGSLTTPATNPTYFGIPTVYKNGCFVIVIRNNSDDPGGPLNDTDSDIILFITCTMIDGAQRQIEARIKYTGANWTPTAAIVTGGTAQLMGSLNVIGSGAGAGHADVVSNANVNFGGSARVNGTVSAVGTVAVSGAAHADNGTVNGVATSTLPDADPTHYKNLATYIFKSNGTVTDAAGTVQGTNSWKGWSFSGGQWSSTSYDATMPFATYYFETDIKMTGQSFLNGTGIVEGSVSLQGQGSNMPNVISTLGNVAFLSGGDILVNGTANLTGDIIAREQIKMAGNFTLNGSSIAKDEFDHSSLVSTSSSYDDLFSGNATINYSGPSSTFLANPQYSCSIVYVRRTK